MIDIHHHLLFGLDDGSRDIETSVAMAEMAAADGITHVVCTPHANSHYDFDPVINRQTLEELRARVEGKITLGLGCDFHLSFENIDDALKNPHKYTINQKNYLLVEFADLSIPQQMTEVFHQFLVAGVQPIITHPERNLTIHKTPHRLNEWIDVGCLVQVTASSLTGRFGRVAMTFAQKLLQQNKVHFLATDAHNLQSRPPRMKEAFDLVAKQYGAETAERLCITNPRAAFFGEQLPPQPATLDSAPPREKQSLWVRLRHR
ncbi:MAG: CpsB/CapC family capsule biosynthesis tyrosine phosphatase [Acidobacteriaceae bacterium]